MNYRSYLQGSESGMEDKKCTNNHHYKTEQTLSEPPKADFQLQVSAPSLPEGFLSKSGTGT